jgi:hypothetical protein
MPTINPVQSALAAAHTQAAQKASELNTTAAPKTGTTVVKTAAPQDQVTISNTARQAQAQTLQTQQAKPQIASGGDADHDGDTK